MYKNLSSVTLYKLPIPMTRSDVVNWSKVDKKKFFDSCPKLELDDWTDLYKEREILIPLNAEIARDNYNYIKYHYKNEVGVDEEFYYFVENFIYISQEVCMPFQILDTWTTYSHLLNKDLKYYVSRLTCKAEKYHRIDGLTPPKYKYTNIDYDDSTYYVVLLNRSKHEGYIPTGKFSLRYNDAQIDEIPFEGIYVFCNSQGLRETLNYEYAEYVENIYSVVGEQISFCKSQVDSRNAVYYYNQTVNIGKVITISQPTGYTDIMKRFPYYYVSIMGNVYDPIDFNNPKDIKFLQLAIPVFQGGISYIPLNYRNEEVNRDNTITIPLCTSVGGIMNYENSIAYNELKESYDNTINAASATSNTASAKLTDEVDYQKGLSDNGYKEMLFQNKVADLQSIYDIDLGIGSAGLFIGLAAAGSDVLADVPLVGGALKAVCDGVSTAATNIGDELAKIGDQDIREILKNKHKKEEDFRTEKKPLQVEVINANYLAATYSAEISKRYLDSQPNLSVIAGDLVALVDKNKPQIITIDNNYIDNMRNYYDITAHDVKEYKYINVYNYSYGKYYNYIKAMLVDTPDIELSVLLGLMDIINTGVRIWNTVDKNIFCNYSLLNTEVE